MFFGSLPLRATSTLRHIDLSGNRLTGRALKALAYATKEKVSNTRQAISTIIRYLDHQSIFMHAFESINFHSIQTSSIGSKSEKRGSMGACVYLQSISHVCTLKKKMMNADSSPAAVS
jgi:hypothetical protein